MIGTICGGAASTFGGSCGACAGSISVVYAHEFIGGWHHW